MDWTLVGSDYWAGRWEDSARCFSRPGSAQIGVAGVAVASPALWPCYEDAVPGAFDSATDFDEALAWGQQDQLDGIAVRIDCREGDPFYENTRDYVNGFDTQPAGGFQLGDHDVGYWRRMAPDQLQFLADCLVAA